MHEIEPMMDPEMAELLQKDRVLSFEGCILRHSPLNDRVYVMKIARDNVCDLLECVDKLVDFHNYSKVFAKVPDFCIEEFQDRCYEQEAYIPGYYSSEIGCSFMGLFMQDKRRVPSGNIDLGHIADLDASSTPVLPAGYSIRKCTVDDVAEMADIYSRIFSTYPFPIHDARYLQTTMLSHVDYFAVIYDKRIVALSSSEIDREHKTVEMTDFAVLNQHRGRGFGRILLSKMEESMSMRGMRMAYTIARAQSPGINRTFARGE